MKLIFKNLIKVLSKKISLISTIISILLISSLFYYFTDWALIIWNLWLPFYILQLTLDTWIALLFWLFIWSTLYKINYFSWSTKKELWVWWAWSFFWILISWCPACSITLASYLGLAWIISALPFYGIELKLLSFSMLLYVVYDTLKTLEVCKIKK